MENEKTPLYVAFSTQKGGVGKTTFTVLAASYLYYLKGYDVAVVDCDYPQHSIAGMRKRDAEQVGADEDYKRMAYEQFTRLGKKAYPVLCSSPEKAIATADEHIAAGHVPDIVFFDLPGTVNSEGVINSLAGMDYIFTPISADKVVLESSLSFAMAIQKLLVKNEACRLAGLYLFWNMVDGREKTDLYTAYDKTIKELKLPDGTKVWLNKNTTLKYPHEFAGKGRKVYLEGEGYFEVMRNPEKPFVVQSEVMQVRVLGTVFNLKSDKAKMSAVATLLKGEVEVKGNHGEGMIILAPGQKAELNGMTRRLVVKQVDTGIENWHNNEFVFEKADLYTIARTLENSYGVRVILAPNIDVSKTYSGTLKKKESVGAVLNLIKNAIPLEYKIVGNSVFLSSTK